MTPRCSPAAHEVHDTRHSAVDTREPPSLADLVSTPDEGASSHGSQDCWGYTLEAKHKKTVQIVLQNIAGLSSDPAL